MAYHTHLTKLHRIVYGSSETPNESQMDSLYVFIKKLQWKAKAIGELHAKIAGKLQDPE